MDEGIVKELAQAITQAVWSCVIQGDDEECGVEYWLDSAKANAKVAGILLPFLADLQSQLERAEGKSER